MTVRMLRKAQAYLGVSHIHNVLVSLHTLHDVEAVTVQYFGLRIARNHQEDITSDAVLQGFDLMAGIEGGIEISSFYKKQVPQPPKKQKQFKFYEATCFLSLDQHTHLRLLNMKSE